MALYLGSSQVKIKVDNTNYTLNIYDTVPSGSVILWSLDKYVLKDRNGNQIYGKEDG